MDSLAQSLSNIVKEVEESTPSVSEAVGVITQTIGSSIHEQTDAAAATETGHPMETTQFSTPASTDDMLSCSMSTDYYAQNISKMIRLGSTQWTTNQTAGQRILLYWLPGSLFSDDTMPGNVSFKFFRYIRTGYHFRLFVDASPGIAGSLIMVYFPGGWREESTGSNPNWDFNSVLSLPHAILDPRCSNQADLVVPHVHYQNYVNYTLSSGEGADGGTLAIFVYAQMRVGSSFAGSIDLTVYGETVEPDFQCPRPFNQGGSRRTRRRTVQPPPNPPVMHHTFVDSAPGCANLSNVCSTGNSESLALVGESTVIDYSTAGCSSNIDDLLEIMRKWTCITYGVWSVNSTPGSTISELTLNLSTYGNFGAIMSCFQYFRGSIEVMVLTYASPLVTARFQLSWFPELNTSVTLNQCRNGIYVTSDVGCGPANLVLPFTHYAWRKETNTFYGRLTLSTVNRIAYNQTAPSEIPYRILIRAGPDFQLMCPRNPFSTIQGLGDNPENPVLFINYEVEQIPIQNQSHTKVSNYFGRLQHIGQYSISAATVTKQEILPNIPGFRPLTTVAYWTGEMVVSITSYGGTPLFFCHKYTTYTISTESDMLAHGCIVIPPYGTKTVNIPFYNPTPFRKTNASLGNFYFLSKEALVVDVNIGFRNFSVFFPKPCSTGAPQATAFIRDLTCDGDVESNPGPTLVCRVDQVEDGFEFNMIQKWKGFITKNRVSYHSWHLQRPPSTPVFSRFSHRRSILWTYQEVEVANWSKSNGQDISITYITKRNFLGLTKSTVRSSEWERDLTTEGIEPNPGPIVLQQTRYKNWSVQTRHFGAWNNYNWTFDHFSNGSHHLNCIKIQQGGHTIPFFLAKFETIASWDKTILIFKVGVRVDNHWEFLRTKINPDKAVEFEFDGNKDHFHFERYSTKNMSWTSIRPLSDRNVGVSMFCDRNEVEILFYPAPQNQPHQFKFLKNSWRRDLTIDGDVESNPGPSQWLVHRSQGHDGELSWKTETLVLIDIQGEDVFMVGPIINIKKTRRTGGAKKVVYTYYDGQSLEPVEHIEYCHRNCWLNDLTIDGDVESNPGPAFWRVDKSYGSDEFGSYTLTEFVQLFNFDGHELCTGLIIKLQVHKKTNGAKRTTIFVTTNMVDYDSVTTCCHERCWVRDLTRDGDIESNPGPWTPDDTVIVVLGPPGSGKSFVSNLILGSKVFFEQPDRNKPSYCDSIRTHQNLIIVDSGPFPNIKDFVSKFVFVENTLVSQTLTNQYIDMLNRSYPNWQAHTVIYRNSTQSGSQDLEFQVMGRVAETRTQLMDMLDQLKSPYFHHLCKLVYKERQAYRHYGVRYQGKVFHLNTANILTSALQGKTDVQVDLDPTSWIETDEVSYTNAISFVNSGAVSLDFNFDSNCETWAKLVMGNDTPCQSARLKWCLTVSAAMAFLYSGVYLENQSPGLFSKVISGICGNFFKNLECTIIKIVIRTVCRILCYLILYCHSPNLLTTGVIVALISMDLMSIEVDDNVKYACESLANGDFNRFCSDIIDLTGDPDAQSLKAHIPKFVNSKRSKKSDIQDQGPKPFNEWTTAAKNVKWWVESLMQCLEWIQNKLFPNDARNKIAEMEAKSNEIGLIMALADEHICKCRTDKNYILHKETPKKHAALVDKLVSFNIEDMPSQMSNLQSKLNSLLSRLQSINIEPPMEFSHRVEPLGIWIQGAPGCGKSFLSHFIVQQLSKAYGWEPYAHPIGSDHMDGYIDQEIHIFDDLGQNREEEDVALMCNLISSVPFIVPKASLETKGCRYQGKVVIATTNKKDFNTNKLLESTALQRRFPIVLEIRPRDQYRRDDAYHRCRFNAVNATSDGSLMRGECWEINVDAQNSSRTNDCWQPLNPNILMDDIIREIDSRMRVCEFMNQGNLKIHLESDGPDMISDLFPEKPKHLSKFTTFVAGSIASFKDFVDRNRTWFIAAGALGTVISLATLTIPYVRKWMGKESCEEENFYGGKTCPLKLKDYKIPLSNQSPIDMKPISRLLVTLSDSKENTATALAIGGKSVITYGHEIFKSVKCFRDEEVDWELMDPVKITINGDTMDLAQYEVKTNIQFKSINSKIHGEDYNGDGYLIWKEGKSYCYIPVSCIRPTSTLITQQGTTTQHTYTYSCRTWKGLCGAVLVGIVCGNPKILGIHVAGNKSMGMSARLFPMFDQGKATEVRPNPHVYFQPRRTKYEPSPLQGQNPQFGPAVLSKNDSRLEVKVDDVTKLAAEKYIGNKFSPDFKPFTLAKSHVTYLLSQVVRPSGNLTFEQATCSDILPIDWQSSPGLKYSGQRKQDLVNLPSFREDVMRIIDGGPTYFTCYLKDELRPVDKIKIGKTRAIEAGNFDYVVAWRMVMGNITSQLFNDQERKSGFAPGLNPYTHWDSMMDNVRKFVVGLDFKNYDGSLSPQVMRHAVDILACFHKDPAMVRAIHEPTIVSTNLVSDEIWQVDGGMCSGSPCTTVLNTIVNLLVNYTVLFSLGYSPSECYVIGYGDDTILSADHKVDISGLQARYKDFFGMNVTSADKTDAIGWKNKEELEFLKRTTTLFPRTSKMVGKLDINNMKGHIEWTTGSFQSQLDSFYLELVLHGQEVYEEIRRDYTKLAPIYNHLPFEAAWQIMYSICMVF
nr:polyprotein [Mute swan feces associated avihepatovirus]